VQRRPVSVGRGLMRGVTVDYSARVLGDVLTITFTQRGLTALESHHAQPTSSMLEVCGRERVEVGKI
jgi:hypothetical protein